MPDARYAPAREDGTKPYVVTFNRWGRPTERLVYVEKRIDARDAAIDPRIYMTALRRASPEDVTNLKEYR